MLRLSLKIFAVNGVPVRLHVSLLVLLLFFIARTRSFWMGLCLSVILLASVLLHEMGHTFLVLQGGGRVRSVDLWILGGMAVVDRPPSGMDDELKMALAGPAVSLGLAVFFAFLRIVANAEAGSATGEILRWGVTLNLILFGFNLLSAFPMDGGRVLRAFMARFVGFGPATWFATRLGKILAVVLGLIGLFSGGVFLILIAILVYMAAEREQRTVRIKEMMGAGQWTETGGEGEETPAPEIKISPPPYERESKTTGIRESIREAIRKLFKSE